jgi:hypothetical protein
VSSAGRTCAVHSQAFIGADDAGHRALEAAGQGATAREEWRGKESNESGGGAAQSVAAGLAAELGSKWGLRSAEPREGARVAAEGTLEEEPEPCMLAQGTIDTAQRLWKFGV